jgi:rhodanese-related sulfurtransferase
MDRIPEFIGNHPLLLAALLTTIAMIVTLEVQRARRAARPITPARATRLNNSDDAVFVDTRARKHFEEGHLPGARSLPAGEVESYLKQIDKLRERPLILYDDGGLDAERAAKVLARNGFNQLYTVEGGIPAWRKAELPTQSGSGESKGQGGQKKKKKGNKTAQSKS